MELTIVSYSILWNLWKARHTNDEIDRRLDHPVTIVAWMSSLASVFQLIVTTMLTQE